MKKYIIAIVTAVVAMACNQTATTKQDSGNPSNELDSVSYYIGLSFGQDLKKYGKNDYNMEMMKSGLNDAMYNDSLDVDMQMVGMYVYNYLQKKDNEVASTNEEEALAWLEENKGKEGVMLADEGYQYKILTEGTGETPTAEDTVTVHYVGTLIDGTEFDNSLKKGMPAVFRVDRVIQGWSFALQNMKVGSKWQLFIPPSLGYGPGRGPSGTLPPNSALIFEVELLDLKRK